MVEIGFIEDIYYMFRNNLIQKFEIILVLYKFVDSYKDFEIVIFICFFLKFFIVYQYCVHLLFFCLNYVLLLFVSINLDI